MKALPAFPSTPAQLGFACDTTNHARAVRAFITTAASTTNNFRKGNQLHRATSPDYGARDGGASGLHQCKRFLSELNARRKRGNRATSPTHGADGEEAIQRQPPRFLAPTFKN